MKVLQLSKFYWPVMGGIETVAWELTEGLNRAGIATDVLCSNQAPRSTRETFASGYQVVRAASWGMLLSTSMAPAMIFALRRAAPAYDIIHVHMPDPMAALALWAVRPKARVVLHWHSDVVRQSKALKLYQPLQTWMLKRADAIVATSHAYADASLPLRPWRSKVVIVPIGIRDHLPDACSERVEAIRRRFRGRKIVFSLGRMTHYKGFDVLIAAAEALPNDSAVMVGGDGDLLEAYRRTVARRGLAGKVQFLGHIPDTELADHFQACDVFCMPSTVRAEAYGVAMVEAMAMGKPVVATDIAGSGVPWVNIHGQTGFNVPVGQSGPLASALSHLLGSAALSQQLGAASRQRYLREFGAELMTRRTFDLYRRLMTA
jgi:rhamnosyl/mannosyltransferase